MNVSVIFRRETYYPLIALLLAFLMPLNANALNAFITNQGTDTVSVVNTATNTVSTTITVGNGPTGAAVTPNGSTLYVANRSDGTVSVINTATNTVSTTITVGSDPSGVAITPDGTKAYVTNQGSGTVSVINTATNTVSATVTVGSTPWGVAISPDGTKAYVANDSASSGSISVINTATNAIITTISSATAGPCGIAITPNGSNIYVGNQSAGTVSVVSAATNSITTTITVGTNPCGLAITPNGQTVYVANEGSSNVSVISTATNTVSTTVSTGAAGGVAITPDGTAAYVTNTGSNSVSVISTATNTVSTTISGFTSAASFGQFIQPATQTPVASGTTGIIPPQGRLTLSSTAPVMTADATAQSTIYYLPYAGGGVPVYSGAAFTSYLLNPGGISLALDSTTTDTGYQASGSLYDIFAFTNGGLLTLGTGPAWSNSTSLSTRLTQVNGIWVNTSSITVRYGSATGNTVSVPAYQATYLGSMYATANGKTGMQFQPTAATGGSNSMLALYNAYNRVTVSSLSSDSNLSWSYSTATVRPADNSILNRINWVDGLQQSFVRAEYEAQASCTSGNEGVVAVGLDSTTTNIGVAGTNVSIENSLRAAAGITPQLGFHYAQALENSAGGTGTTFFGGVTMQLKVDLEM